MSTQSVALVTGAGSGIGRATAVALARGGRRVVLVGRSRSALEETRGITGEGGVVMPCDVGDPDAVLDLCRELAERYRRLDVLVNCAAQTAAGTLAAVNPEAALRLWQVNVLSAILLTQGCLPLLTTPETPISDGDPAGPSSVTGSQGAAVINVTTSIGARGWPGSGVYAATKAALESLTRTWALELAPAGVRVLAVAPGAVETPMATSSGANPAQVAALRAWQREHTPLGRVADASEVADVIAFLVGPGAKFMTGAVIPVDGGAVIA